MAERRGNESVLRFDRLSKHFRTEKGETVRALDQLSLEVPRGEFVCIVGPSGCGKSSLLRIAAGLSRASSGQACYCGSPLEATCREIGMVFQEYSLLPWRSVIDNIVLGLEFERVPRPEALEAAEHYLRLVGLTGFRDAMPYELSGGMQQRVAIARAMANNPEVLLMDEPFGALDAHTRILLQKELLSVWEKNRKTILFVTHSVDEAIYLADRIIVMSARPGKIRKSIALSMDRPRKRTDPAWGRLAAEILEMLEEEVVSVV